MELIVVDNGCTDGTTEFTFGLWNKLGYPFPLRIIQETRPGVVHARDRGMQQCTYDIILFCDDDNWLDSSYARIGVSIMRQHPTIGFLGGSIQGVFESTPPAWFQRFSGAWAISESNYQGFIGKDSSHVRTAGMFIRKQAFVDLLNTGFAFMALGRMQSVLSRGEDAELCDFIRRIGYEAYYDGRLRMKHWIPSNRLTWGYALRLWRGFGGGTVYHIADRIHSSPKQHIRNLFRGSFLYQIVRGGLPLLPLLVRYKSLRSKEGNAEGLAISSRIGRFLALAKFGSAFSYAIRQRLQVLTNIEKQKEEQSL